MEVLRVNRIEVDPSRVECEINPMVYGHFIENMARCIYGGLLENQRPGNVSGPWSLRQELIMLTKQIKPPVLRWPGGLYADGYFWRDGVGPREARPLRRNRYWSRYGPFTRVLDPNAFGSDEFMNLARKVKAEPYVNVNFGTGSALEAAKWVEYMNGSQDTLEGRRRAEYGRKKPWGVRIWGIGNETYGFWALGHCGAEEYARRYLEFRDAMEQVDPGLEYVAVGADRYLNKNWNREVLQVLGGRVDLLSIHIYLPGMERMAGVLYTRALRGSGGLYKAIVAAPLEIERRLREVEDDIASVIGKGEGPRVALDEWNLWWRPDQLLKPRWTLRDALFVCGVFHAMHRMADFVSMGNIAQLVNVLGVIGASRRGVFRTTLYYPFLMYGTTAGSMRVNCEANVESFDSPAAGGIPAMKNVPLLDCSATISEDGESLTLFVINRHDSRDLESEISIRDFSPGKRVSVCCLNGPGVDAANSYEDDEAVSVERTSTETDRVLPKCLFLAHSATAITFEKG